ncbi:MAG: non-hydrolyzing UDP-N-acetylglucosamine 2-epimerase [Desulfomonilaceae bacterium]
MTKTIISVVGARPNFMKVGPLERQFKLCEGINHMIVHTGQHYDDLMSGVFFDDLGLSAPARHLGVGSGRHGEMTGKIMIEFERVCLDIKPDLVIVVGDVNSTVAAALVARKLFIPVAHVEAGLRSFDETMPEEWNRRLTDVLSNLLYVSEPVGLKNLEREGVDEDRILLVGDIMLETLGLFLSGIQQRNRWVDFGLSHKNYILVTIHRPSNVDEPSALEQVIGILESLPIKVIFPIHPRTLKRLDEFGFRDRVNRINNLLLVDPQSYIDFLSLLNGCSIILSDSGSVQAEASFFDVPCLVCRENTERPVYCEQGSCRLVGRDLKLIKDSVNTALNGDFPKSTEYIKKMGNDVSGKIARSIVKFLA